jgi:hypothetical protein
VVRRIIAVLVAVAIVVAMMAIMSPGVFAKNPPERACGKIQGHAPVLVADKLCKTE